MYKLRYHFIFAIALFFLLFYFLSNQSQREVENFPTIFEPSSSSCFVNETLLKLRKEKIKTYCNGHLENKGPLNWDDFNRLRNRGMNYDKSELPKNCRFSNYFFLYFVFRKYWWTSIRVEEKSKIIFCK